MVILNAEGLSKSYGIDRVFDGVSFKVADNDKIGIVGVNGAGKTTLFRVLASEEEADSGTVIFDRNVTFAYMRQHSDYTSQRSAEQETLDVFIPLIELEASLAEVNQQLQASTDSALIARQDKLMERFVSMGGLTYRNRVRSTLMGLGFSEEELALPMCSLSGGQRTRVLLAKILLSDSKLLLLDEPTNHLDVKAVQWLEDFLIAYRGAVMLISHDRYFLDRVCNRMFEMENGRLDAYTGNYTEYRRQKALKRLTAEREYERGQREIKRVEGIIEQQKRFNQAHNYVTIKSKQKQIDRIASTLEKPESDPDEIHFTFHSCGPCANEVLKAEHISKSFEGIPLFSDVNMLIRRGERAFICGANGCGKTTLLRILLAQEAATSGQTIVGPRVKIGYYDQTQGDLNPLKTVFDEVHDSYPEMDNTSVRCALGAFLFKGEDVYKKVADLSGGERARVCLVKLMLAQTNFLILDEPTNHLDIDSKEVLENALLSYDGTLLIVSHDRYFIKKLACKIYELGKDGVTCFEGDYDYYLEKSCPQQESRIVQKNTKYLEQKAQQSQVRKRQNRLKKVEELITQIESDILALQETLSDPEIAGDYIALTEKTEQLNVLMQKSEELYDEWAQLSE